MADDPVMQGFLFLKALVHRYGKARSAELVTLADRLVANKTFPTRRAAVAAIEEQVGLTVTVPLSEEGATHVTRRDQDAPHRR